MNKELFTAKDGTPIEVFTLDNHNGVTVRLTNFGATIMDIMAPDKNGKSAHIVTGYDATQGFLDGNCYFGATVGRYANRIAHGRFMLGGKSYQLSCNDGRNHLHGGFYGFDHKLWQTEEDSGGIKMTYESADGEEGYPAKLLASVRFSLSDDGTLELNYTAEADGATVLNLTNHTYFNLARHDAGNIGGHWLQIFADRFTPVDAELIPIGEDASVIGTPLDFTSPHRVGERIDDDFEQLMIARGYDHSYCVNGSGIRMAARVFEPGSGRTMTVYTDKPCIQLYSGNFLNDILGRDGAVYQRRGALCIETQFAPNSPNRSESPSCVLHPGEVYAYTTRYQFGLADGWQHAFI